MRFGKFGDSSEIRSEDCLGNFMGLLAGVLRC